MGCTEVEWLRWLPEAIGDNFWKLQTHSAGVRIGDGAFRVHLTQQCPLAACGGRRGQSDGNTGFSNATFASDKEQLTRKQWGWL